MCPDRELLSVWVDGEIPSPWRETIDRHVGACPGCAAVVASMRETKALFSADIASMDEATCAAKTRLQERLESSLPSRQTVHSNGFRSGAGALWLHKFSVPFPAAAAAALVLAVLGFSLLASGRRNADLQVAVRRAFEATPVATSGMGIESIIEYVSSQNTPFSININLPAEAFGGTAGEPFIVREADYKPGSRK